MRLALHSLQSPLAAAWVAAGALVAFGPWPLAMVSVPGAKFANTWPPSLALVAYGLGACAFAIAAAPRLSAMLGRRERLWTVVVAANTMTMTSYLWHFTALAAASLMSAPLGLLPHAAPGSGAWWVQKLPVMAVAFGVLAGLVLLLSSRERRELLCGGTVSRPVHVAACVAASLGARRGVRSVDRGARFDAACRCCHGGGARGDTLLHAQANHVTAAAQ